MALSVKYAEPGSPGALSDKIGWIDYGSGFTINPGQSIAVTNEIPGGYTISFTLSLEQTGTPLIPLSAVIPPTIVNESAFGTTGYVNINAPVALYMTKHANFSLVSLTLSLNNIQVKNSSGRLIDNYSIIAADSETTNKTEAITFITNGTPWIKIDTLPAVTKNTASYTLQGEGSTIVTVSTSSIQGIDFGRAPSIVLLTDSPTEVQTVIETYSGKQGVVFGVIINDILQPLCSLCNVNI